MILKKSKRAAAAIIAAVSTAAMAASMTPAFAYEDISAAQEAFVYSFDEGTDRDCAQYLLDAGFSLAEAEDYMEVYMTGLAKMEAKSTAYSSVNYYYNTANLAPTEHFALIIATTPTYTARKVDIELTGQVNELSTSEGYYMYSTYAGYVGSVEYDYDIGTREWMHSITLRTISASDSSAAVQAIRIPVSSLSSNATEYSIYQGIDFGVSTVSDYQFAMETYAKGDINHDGFVDESDSTMLLQFLAEKISSFDITYADGSNHYSAVTNAAAADFNLDGLITLVDLTMLTQYIS